MRHLSQLICLSLVFACLSVEASEYERPLMRDFIGLNGHYNFKPELYRPTCRLVRNYHNINWDVAAPGDPITFPICVNKVNWETFYAKWKKHDLETNACLMFGSFGAGHKDYQTLWGENLDWAEDYGYAVAKGLSDKELATSIEIGNEPGKPFNDDLFQKVFKSIATGVRRADPDMKILTCTVHAGPADKYHKQLSETFSDPKLLPYFDVLSVHVYSEKAEKDQMHPWERSYPEDSSIDYLTRVDEIIDWRDRNAPGKEVWITEFGYDACSDAAMKKREGWFKKLGWTGQTELEQAQWLVRSMLCFTARDVDRAYIYFYDDKDKASIHASSGLTRNFKPKPAYWAVKQFYELLGDYRLSRVISEVEGDLYAYEFVDDTGQLIWVLWSPTGSGRSKKVTLQQLASEEYEIIPMATVDSDMADVVVSKSGSGLALEVGESPVYICFK